MSVSSSIAGTPSTSCSTGRSVTANSDNNTVVVAPCGSSQAFVAPDEYQPSGTQFCSSRVREHSREGSVKEPSPEDLLRGAPLNPGNSNKPAVRRFISLNIKKSLAPLAIPAILSFILIPAFMAPILLPLMGIAVPAFVLPIIEWHQRPFYPFYPCCYLLYPALLHSKY